MKHGVITWGATARESYERMIDVVSDAERYVAAHAKTPLRAAVDDVARRGAARVRRASRRCCAACSRSRAATRTARTAA